MLKDEIKAILDNNSITIQELIDHADMMMNDEILSMREDGHTWKMIADVTGGSAGKVNTRWRRAMGKKA